MLYLKERTGEGRYTVIELTADNVFSVCPICGDEAPVNDFENIITGRDFYFNKSVCCPVCTAKIREKGLAALMDERKEELSHSLQGL